MITDYKINAKHLPSERDVWLMSGRAEADGHKINLSLLNAMANGEVRYIDGQFYRFCRHCVDYHPLDKFHENKRYVLNVNYICKECVATRRRIKTYGIASYVTDVGMRDTPHSITFNLDEETKKIIKARLGNGHYTEKDNRL